MLVANGDSHGSDGRSCIHSLESEPDYLKQAAAFRPFVYHI